MRGLFNVTKVSVQQLKHWPTFSEKKEVVADFDRDGIVDKVELRKQELLFFKGRFGGLSSYNAPIGIGRVPNGSSLRLALDYNGDGAQDIMIQQVTNVPPNTGLKDIVASLTTYIYINTIPAPNK